MIGKLFISNERLATSSMSGHVFAKRIASSVVYLTMLLGRFFPGRFSVELSKRCVEATEYPRLEEMNLLSEQMTRREKKCCICQKSPSSKGKSVFRYFLKTY